MQDVVSISPVARRRVGRLVLPRLLAYLPRGNTLDDRAWARRHRLLQRVLFLHVPLLVGLGFALGHTPVQTAQAVVVPVACLAVGHFVTHRRWASFFVTGGLVFCSIALVLLTSGSIEAHFHFFIIIGFIALYQDWVPFLWNVAFTTVSHGIGTIWLGGQIFNHPAAQANPWLWSFVHGVAVLIACVGMVIFWRVTEDEQVEKEALGRQLITADAEIGRRKFTSEMLVNLARRNQSMLYRQLDIINELENREQDPDALADLFKLDHLATRVRRNAESLLVLAGQQTPRTWSEPVPLRDVIRAAIAETEDLDRVVFAVDDRIAVSGTVIADLTHLLAELTENAVRFSSPETAVTIRVRNNRRDEGGYLLTVEDWGVGMPADDLAEANELLARPGEIDLAVAQRLGFHVVARLAARHGIDVSLTSTPGSGITAVVVLPSALFVQVPAPGPVAPLPGRAGPDPVRPNAAATPARSRGGALDDGAGRTPVEVSSTGTSPTSGGTWPPPVQAPDAPGSTGPDDGRWRGWWSPETHAGADASHGFGATGREVWSTDASARAGVNRGPDLLNGSTTGGPGAGRDHGNGGVDGNRTNGHGVTGSGVTGSGVNGSGVNGSGVTGSGVNGSSVNGSGVKGSRVNGAGVTGSGVNGIGLNRSGVNGSGVNGSGVTGSGVTGSGVTGSGVTGSGVNGSGVNGSGVNGHGTDGHATDGHGADGHDVNGSGVDGQGGPASGRPGVRAADRAAGAAAGAAGVDGTVRGGTAPQGGCDAEPVRGAKERGVDHAVPGPTDVGGSEQRSAAVPAPDPAPALAMSPARGIPLARAGRAEVPDEGVGGGAEAARPPVAAAPARRDGAATPPPDRRLPDRSPGGPSPVAALPVPRAADSPPADRGGAPRSSGPRTLRRRVPQSHLAPELRHLTTGLADTAAPLSADAAATALSRYQASRRAAQAIVGDDPGVHQQGREGARE